MASNSQPPPRDLPQRLMKDPKEAQYWIAQKNALYQLWATRNIFVSTPPASASAAGKAGTFTWDDSYLYICVDTDTWKRVAIATW